MVNQHAVDLINRAIDGMLTEDEQAQLDALIIKDIAVRAYYDEHVRLSELIAKVEALKPSEHLKDSILGSVRRMQPQRPQPSRIMSSIQSVVSARYMLVFAGGLAAGLAIFTLVGRQATGTASGWDSTSASGTMILDTQEEKLDQLEETTIEINGQIIALRTRRSGELTLLDANLQGESPQSAVIRYLATELELVGISGVAGVNEAVITSGRIELPHLSPGPLVCVFRRLTTISAGVEVRVGADSAFESASLRVE